jgi:hypothetical protein
MSRRKGPKKQIPKRRSVLAHSLQDRFFHKRVVRSDKIYDRNKEKRKEIKIFVDNR